MFLVRRRADGFGGGRNETRVEKVNGETKSQQNENRTEGKFALVFFTGARRVWSAIPAAAAAASAPAAVVLAAAAEP